MVPGPRERRPKSSGSPIAYQVDRVEHLSPDKLFLGFWDFFSMSQNGPTRPRNMSWDPTGYLDPREVHREQVSFLRVDRTWVHLPGSQGRGPGYGRENFRGFFFILSTWTPCTWELYQVHREGGLAPGERIFGDFLYSLKMDHLHLGALPGSQGRGPGDGRENFRGKLF